MKTRSTDLIRALLALVFVAAAGGCNGQVGRYNMADDIPEDHAALNDAFGRSINGQILLNTLRSRDRWPRHYIDVPTMNDQPSVTVRATGILNPLDLNNSGDPYRASQLQGYREEVTRPGYSVQPYTTEAISRALSPTQRRVFEHFWSSGWSRDVLLLVTATSFTRLEANHEITAEALRAFGNSQVGTTFDSSRPAQEAFWLAPRYNSATELSLGDCAVDGVIDGDGPGVEAHTTLGPHRNEWVWPDVDPGAAADATDEAKRCAFFNLVHMFALYGADNIRLRRESPCVRSAVAALNKETGALLTGMANAVQRGPDMSIQLEELPPETESATISRGVLIEQCISQATQPVVLEVLSRTIGEHGERDVVATYYVRMRSLDDMVYAMGELLRTPATHLVRTPDCRVDCALVPLFAVSNDRSNRSRDFAAVVAHRGVRYYAGPGVASPAEHGGDRTGTVLTLLAQLFALTHSPGALGALPPRAVIN